MSGDPWFWRMKASHRDLIARCGGIAHVADVLGLSVAMAGKFNNPNEENLFSARQKARLEQHCGEPIVTRAELELQGYSLAPLPRLDAAGSLCPNSAMAQVLIEAADVAKAYAQGVADGRYSPADAALTEPELEQLARVVEQARLANAALRGCVSPP